MWFEVLPGLGIIMGCLLLPQIGCYVINRLALHGKPYRRTLADEYDRMLYHRDVRIAKDAYRTRGLEAIPDQ